MEQQQDRTDETITHWTAKGIKLEAGAPEEKLIAIEEIMGFKFPDDFRKL
jgi:hypothetical protein